MLEKSVNHINWKMIKLGDIADFKNGLNYRAGKNKFSYHILSVASFQDYGVISNISNLSKVDLDRPLEEGFQLLDRDLVFVRSNGNPDLVGRCVMVFPGDIPTTFSGFTIRARIAKNKITTSEWVHICLKAGLLKKSLKREGAGTNITNLNQQILSSVLIPIPPIEEQMAIAAVLSIWDKAIEKTERLIKLKEDHFRWLGIQAFKNPKINSWNFSTLGQLVKVKKGEQRNRSELDEKGMYPAWNGGITPSGYTDVWNTKENTITISEGGNSCGFVNYCKQKFWCGGHCYSLINKNNQISDQYLYFYLKTYEKRIMSLRVGSGLPNIQKGDIENFEITYPNLEEQSVISHEFNIVLTEVTLIKQLLDLYKSQKQGLMQKLLTGKWRVNFKEEK